MADIEFEVAQRRNEPITFTLGYEPDQSAGEDPHLYVFNPPKSALMLMPILNSGDMGNGLEMTKSTFDWLGEGLSDEDNDRIKKRLADPRDGLDVPDLADVIQKLSERATGGRPTT